MTKKILFTGPEILQLFKWRRDSVLKKVDETYEMQRYVGRPVDYELERLTGQEAWDQMMRDPAIPKIQT